MIFTPKGFLLVGGIVLVLVGVLGFFLIGPDAETSIFNEVWVFDKYENWAHLFLGVVALIAAYVLPARAQKILTLIVGLLALFFAIYNIFEVDFGGAMLQQPADTILHFVVGIWALWAAKGGGSSMSSSMPSSSPPSSSGMTGSGM